MGRHEGSDKPSGGVNESTSTGGNSKQKSDLWEEARDREKESSTRSIREKTTIPATAEKGSRTDKAPSDMQKVPKWGQHNKTEKRGGGFGKKTRHLHPGIGFLWQRGMLGVSSMYRG